MKEDILKKKGGILQVLDLSKLALGDNKNATAPRYHSPVVDSQINEMFMSRI